MNNPRVVQWETRNELVRLHVYQLRTGQSEEQRDEWNFNNRLRMRQNRHIATASGDRPAQQNLDRRLHGQAAAPKNLLRAAFSYDPSIDYNSNSSVVIISNIDVVCCRCMALKFSNEPSELCCASGKVKLPPLNLPGSLGPLVSGSGSNFV